MKCIADFCETQLDMFISMQILLRKKKTYQVTYIYIIHDTHEWNILN